MTFLQVNEKINFYLTCLIAFTISAYPKIVAPLIVLLAANWLTAIKINYSKLNNIYKFKSIFILVALYIVYLIGMLYSSNIKFGIETIETKLSFVIFPLALSGYIEQNKQNIYKYLKIFIWGCVAYSLICLCYAFYCYYKPVYIMLYGSPYYYGSNYFYYEQLSMFLHPSYISMYCVLALASIYYLITKNEIKQKLLYIFVAALLVVFVFLLSSKAGWLCLIGLGSYLFYKLLKKKKIVILIVSTIIILSTFFVINVHFVPMFSERIPKFEQIKNSIKYNKSLNDSIQVDGSTGGRILIWKSAIQVAKNNYVFGVGTGDAKDFLVAKYKENGMVREYENRLNAHNQYFNVVIAMGLAGLLLLILCFVVPLYYSYKNRLFLLAFFSYLVGVNLLFESMFEKEAGAVFFGFFFTLLNYSFTPLKEKNS